MSLELNSSTVSLNFYQQQIPRLIRYSRKDSINVTSILRDCVGGGVATTSALMSTEGLFIEGLSGSRTLLALCSGAEIYSMAQGRRVISPTMGELCLNRVDFTQGLIVARCVWATQLRHSSWCRSSSVSAFDEVAVHTQTFLCLARRQTLWSFCATSPLWYVLFEGNSTVQPDLLQNRKRWP